VDRAALLALMDLNWMEMVREIARTTPGGWVVERAGLVLCGTPRGTIVTNQALVTGPVSPAVVRAETDALFRPAGVPFCIVTRDHADAALQAELRDAGFAEFMNTPAMAFFAGDALPPAPPPDVDVRPVVDDAGRAAYGRVMADAYAVYGTPPESTASHFETLASVCGPTTQAFLVWRDGAPVAGATLYLTHGVAGIGWVGTTPAAFGRGYGPAVTWRAVVEGFRRGARFVNLQASPMGARVYRRMGFSTPTHYRAFLAPD
jgi:hypothetical protein